MLCFLFENSAFSRCSRACSSAFAFAAAAAASILIAFSSSLSWLTVAAPMLFFFSAKAAFSLCSRSRSSAFAFALAAPSSRRFLSISSSSDLGSRPLPCARMRAFISAFARRMRSASSAFFLAFSIAIFLRASIVPLSSPDAVLDNEDATAARLVPAFGRFLSKLSSMAAL